MQTIKTASIVVMLLAVLYGVHTVLTQPPPKTPREAAVAARELPAELDFDEGSLDALPAEADRADSLPPHMDSQFSERPAAGLSSRAERRAAVPPPPQLAPPSTDESSSGSRATGELKGAENGLPQLEPPPGLEPGDAAASSDSPDTKSTDAVDTPPATERLPAVPPLAVNANPPRRAENRAASPADRELTPVEPAARPSTTGAEAASAAFTEGVRFDPKEAALNRGWKAAQDSIKSGDLRQALATLSALYEDPRLTSAERQRLVDTLDPLAARVIYSTEHLLEPAYEVRRGDTLVSLADKYNVPWQLLRNINGVSNPDFLVPNSRLKMVRGPFRAEVDVQANELTVYLNRLYAGRFPVSIGNEPAPRVGDFEVVRKELGRAFDLRNGQSLAAADPRNPWGRCWLDLGSGITIHGTAQDPNGPQVSGCISLSPKDADDVFGILSLGSRVSIR